MPLLVSRIVVVSASAAAGASSHSRRIMTGNYGGSLSGHLARLHGHHYSYLLQITDVHCDVRSNQLDKPSK